MDSPNGHRRAKSHDPHGCFSQDVRVARLQQPGSYTSSQPVASLSVAQLIRSGSIVQSREVSARSGRTQPDLERLQLATTQQDGAPVQHRAPSITRQGGNVSSNPPHHRQQLSFPTSPPPMIRSEMGELGASSSARRFTQASMQAADLVVEDVFLPLRNVHGEMVLVEIKAGQFRVTPGRHFPRLAFRASKDLSDKLEESAERGATIEGVDEGDGWVRCKIPKVKTAIEDPQVFKGTQETRSARHAHASSGEVDPSCTDANHAVAPPQFSEVDVNRTMGRLMRQTERVQEQLAIDRTDIISQSIMHCEMLEEKLSARIDDSVSNLRAELAEIGVFPSSCRGGDLSGRCEASSTASTAASQMHTALEERLVARIALEIGSLKAELVENGVVREAGSGEAFGLGEHLVALATKDVSVLNVVTDQVLQRVRADKSIRHVEEQHDMLKQTLHELLMKLDRGPQGVVKSKDFDALCDTVNESVKLNRALGLELRHQRQQRNQDYSSITSRLASVDAKLSDMSEGPGHADSRSDGGRSDGSRGLLGFVQSQQSDTSLSDGLEQALVRLHELASKEFNSPIDPGPSPRA